MSYKIKKLPSCLKRPWKVQFVFWEGGKRKERDIPQHEWAQYGFHPALTFDEAKARASSLNSQEALKSREAKRVAIRERLAEEDLVMNAYLTPEDVREFERDVIDARYWNSDARQRNKVDSHWRIAKKAICELKLEPRDYAFKCHAFYAYFAKQGYSVAYIQKLLTFINLWGQFQARKANTFFAPVKLPKGHDRQRIQDRYEEDREGSNESAPLTPQMLEAKRSELSTEHANWLSLSVFFGLRPQEVDNLTNPKLTKVEVDENGTQVLAVNQTKLSGIPFSERWKRIPCIYPEQVELLKVIQGGAFKRPLTKTIQRIFGEAVNAYGGRKNFEDMMYGRGRDFTEVSAWLGHRNINRTWTNYRQRDKARYRKGA